MTDLSNIRSIKLLFQGSLLAIITVFTLSCSSTKSPAIQDTTTVSEEPDTTHVQSVVKQEQQSSVKIMQDQVASLKSNVDNLEQQNEQLRGQIDQLQKKVDSLETAPAITDQSESSYVQRYHTALDEFYNGEYATASRKFQELINESHTNDYSDNAQYWLGECYYSVGDYQKALQEFQKVLDYPGANKIPDAQYKIALTYLNMGEMGNARDALKTLKQEYPDSRLIPEVNRHLNALNNSD